MPACRPRAAFRSAVYRSRKRASISDSTSPNVRSRRRRSVPRAAGPTNASSKALPPSGKMCCTSMATPGRHISARSVFPSSLKLRKNPGAVPTGFGMTLAPLGIRACVASSAVMRRRRASSRWVMRRKVSSCSTSRRPVTRATTLRVRSSSVGPRPPVVMTTSARPNACWRAASMSLESSPTTVHGGPDRVVEARNDGLARLFLQGQRRPAVLLVETEGVLDTIRRFEALPVHPALHRVGVHGAMVHGHAVAVVGRRLGGRIQEDTLVVHDPGAAHVLRRLEEPNHGHGLLREHLGPLPPGVANEIPPLAAN